MSLVRKPGSVKLLLSPQRFLCALSRPSGAPCAISAPQKSALRRWLLGARFVIGHRTVALRHRQCASAPLEKGGCAKKQRRRGKKINKKKQNCPSTKQLEPAHKNAEWWRWAMCPTLLSAAAAHLTSRGSDGRGVRPHSARPLQQPGETWQQRRAAVLQVEERNNRWSYKWDARDLFTFQAIYDLHVNVALRHLNPPVLCLCHGGQRLFSPSKARTPWPFAYLQDTLGVLSCT